MVLTQNPVLHWSLMMNNPEKDAYNSTLITRRVVGPVANCIFAAFTACFCGAALFILYYYRVDRDNSHAKIALEDKHNGILHGLRL